MLPYIRRQWRDCIYLVHCCLPLRKQQWRRRLTCCSPVGAASLHLSVLYGKCSETAAVVAVGYIRFVCVVVACGTTLKRENKLSTAAVTLPNRTTRKPDERERSIFVYMCVLLSQPHALCVASNQATTTPTKTYLFEDSPVRDKIGRCNSSHLPQSDSTSPPSTKTTTSMMLMLILVLIHRLSLSADSLIRRERKTHFVNFRDTRMSRADSAIRLIV